MGWMPKIKPIVVSFTPLSFASPGKKGAKTDWMQEPSMPSPNIPIRVKSTIISVSWDMSTDLVKLLDVEFSEVS